MTRGVLLCFVGIDGSGKTTLSSRVQTSAHPPNGRPFGYLWFRSPLQLALSRRLESSRAARGKAKLGAGKDWKPRRATLGSRIYRFAVWLDYLLVVSLKVRWRLWRGENLVCDRYAHDIAVDLSADFGEAPEKLRQRLRWVQRAFPRPDAIFFVDVPEAVSLQRKDDIPNEAFLSARRRGYQLMLELPAVSPIDGTQPPEEVYRRAAKLLEPLGIAVPAAEVQSA